MCTEVTSLDIGAGWTRQAAIPDATCFNIDPLNHLSAIAFTRLDNSNCKATVRELEDHYRENYRRYQKSIANGCNWFQVMIHAMQIKGVTLVDNDDFRELVCTIPNSLSFCENNESLLDK